MHTRPGSEAQAATRNGGPPDLTAANYDSASAVSLVGANSPPTLLILGLLDSTLPISQGEALAAKLTARRLR
jgi:dipeptidyl aminopeptidase/acylaminoacyl peptidase